MASPLARQPQHAAAVPRPTGARVIHRRPLGDPPVLHAAAESNLLPLLLRPRVSATATVTDVELIDGRTLHSGMLALQFTTPVACRAWASCSWPAPTTHR